ncbi:N-acetylmuramoyl-L-alanine amidase [Ornithinibacillus sp. JPR2-1]|uniref:N-acetylmuramoyl-L-alanine amidase n=1 Tax=Ornithinibacillus sp. JPR2-1 TaxID=2094019 RepID=UPI0031DDF4BE
MNIKKQLVSQNVINKRTHGTGNPKKYITIHQTGNTNKGANAQVHANLQSNLNPREASWHYQVDDKEVIQSFDDNVKCWHAGDGRGPGNTESIAIEICINSDGDYKKAVENGAKLTKHLLDKYNLSIDRVKQHYDWSEKNCPAQIRDNKDGISWSDFLKLVQSEEKETVSSSGVYVVEKGDTLWSISQKYNTTVDVLKSLNKISGDLIVPGQKIKLPSGSKKAATKPALKVNGKVKVKKSATKYATGESIPSWVKGKTYTIQQVKSDRVLLKEILSWVFTKDVE